MKRLSLKQTVLNQTLLVLALLVVGCTEPHQKHPNGGLGGSGGAPTDASRDSSDVAQDVPSDQPGAEVDAAVADGEGPDAVVVAEAGSVSEGKPCSTDSNCGSGFCRDGVCCHESCEGICQACSAAFTNLDNGVCGAVVAGMDPRGVCTDESATNSCGQDGTCDGKNACRKQGPDHVCAPASCSADNKFNAAGTCDGNGTCAAGVVMSCGANPCAVTGCAKPCTVDGDCADGNFCSNGTCKIKKIVGDTCDGANQCGSGNCSADKVCCASACTDACMACSAALTGQNNGTCAPVQAGKDPKDNCAADDPKSCGHDGFCDGKGGCSYFSANQVCSDASCDGTKFLREGSCDGKGTCAAVTPVDCQATMCTPNGCKMACTSDNDCAAGFYCASPGAMGSCLPKKSLGAPCSTGQCADGACVDGVCCESACQDKCYACSSTLTGQPDGKCKPIQPAKTPQGECAASDPSGCGLDGSCDGNGQCRKWSSGTSCGAASCSADNQFIGGKTCNGTGTCVTPAGVACGTNKCDATAGCSGACQDNSKCVGNSYCDTMAMKCAPLKAQGAACSTNPECMSQHCIDNVCCASACTDVCYACSAARTNQPDGLCQPAIATLDPHHDCGSADTVGCGSTGLCDGSGHCGKRAKGQSCGNATCSGSTYTPAPACDGMGTCVTPMSQSCGNAVCSGNSCSTTCMSAQDCQSGTYCDAGTGKCLAKKAPGATCAVDGECNVGVCSSGVCCNAACPGPCATCATGTCAPYSEGAADSRCAAAASNTCGLDGTCDRFGHCRKWQGTQCKDASCSTNAFTGAGTCDGSGNCSTPTPVMCTVSTCSTTNGCSTKCVSQSDGVCAASAYCDTTAQVCTTKKTLGSACMNDFECSMGHCADGVCCNSVCNQPCQACNLASPNTGTCTPISGAAKHGSCNGAGTGTGADAMCSGMCAGNADGSCTFAPNSCGTCRRCGGGVCKTITNQTDASCSTMCDGNGSCKVSLTVSKTNLGSASGIVTSSGAAPVDINCGTVCSTSVVQGTAVTLTATPAPGYYFEGWAGSCTGTVSVCTVTAASPVTATAIFSPANTIFVTSTNYTIPFGGVSGADAICQTRATAGNLPGNFVAYIATSSVSMDSRLAGAHGWVRTDGMPFIDQIYSNTVWFPPDHDEFGNAVTSDFPQALGGPPSGTHSSCTDFTIQTSQFAEFIIGVPSAGSTFWNGSGGGSVGCGSQFRFYCLQKDYRVTPTLNPASGRLAFVSTGSFVPNTGLPGADALCAAEAAGAGKSGSFKAMLPTTSASIASRFNANGPIWVRADGVPLVNQASDMFGTASGARLLAPLNVDVSGDKYFGNYNVLTGGTGNPQAVGLTDATCANWTSNSAGTARATRSGASSFLSSAYYGDYIPCSTFAQVFCLQE